MTRLIVAAALGLLASPPSSVHAALETRLSLAPPSPRVGVTAIVSLRPYWPLLRPDGSCCDLEPADVRYPFRVQALGPAGRRLVVTPSRTRDRYVWTARLRLPAAGRWEIRVANYYASSRCQRRGCAYAGPRLMVRVRNRG